MKLNENDRLVKVEECNKKEMNNYKKSVVNGWGGGEKNKYRIA